MSPPSSFFSPGTVPDKSYENLRDFEPWAHHKAFVEQLWDGFRPLADADFLEDAKTHFAERFWEMYVAYVLKEFGFTLNKHGKKGPDFYIDGGNTKICIEATVPRMGTGPDAVPPLMMVSDFKEQGLEPIAQEVPQEQMILRFTSSIEEKRRKYEKYLQDGIISESNPCIIAINGKEVLRGPFEGSSLPYIVRSVFPLGNYGITVDRNFGIVASGHQYRPTIIKSSGSEVQTTYFLSQQFKRISGILYTSVDAINYPQAPGEKFIFIHNHLAQNPLPRQFFKFGIEYWLENDKLCWQKY